MVHFSRRCRTSGPASATGALVPGIPAVAPLGEWRLPVPVPVAARYARDGLLYRADLITEELADAPDAGAGVAGRRRCRARDWRAGRALHRAVARARRPSRRPQRAQPPARRRGGRSTCSISTAAASARAARGNRPRAAAVAAVRSRRSRADCRPDRFGDAAVAAGCSRIARRRAENVRLRILYVLLIYLSRARRHRDGGVAGELRDPSTADASAQRLGFVVPAAGAGRLWVHAVSVGEVQAAAALIRALQARDPGLAIVVTTVTPTGAQRARALFGADGAALLPALRPARDRADASSTASTRSAAIILETEIWPTLYRALARRGIPLVLASARLSRRRSSRYRRCRRCSSATRCRARSRSARRRRPTPSGSVAIGAPADRVQRHRQHQVRPADSRGRRSTRAGRCAASCGAGRAVWIAGSTHEGEEEAALDGARDGARAASAARC